VAGFGGIGAVDAYTPGNQTVRVLGKHFGPVGTVVESVK